MHQRTQLPAAGEVFFDARGGSRALRVAWHSEAGVVVLSLWRDSACAGTFRLSIDEVSDLIGVLRQGLAEAYAEVRGPLIPGMRDVDHLAG